MPCEPKPCPAQFEFQTSKVPPTCGNMSAAVWENACFGSACRKAELCQYDCKVLQNGIKPWLRMHIPNRSAWLWRPNAINIDKNDNTSPCIELQFSMTQLIVHNGHSPFLSLPIAFRGRDRDGQKAFSDSVRCRCKCRRNQSDYLLLFKWTYVVKLLR